MRPVLRGAHSCAARSPQLAAIRSQLDLTQAVLLAQLSGKGLEAEVSAEGKIFRLYNVGGLWRLLITDPGWSRVLVVKGLGPVREKVIPRAFLLEHLGLQSKTVDTLHATTCIHSRVSYHPSPCTCGAPPAGGA